MNIPLQTGPVELYVSSTWRNDWELVLGPNGSLQPAPCGRPGPLFNAPSLHGTLFPCESHPFSQSLSLSTFSVPFGAKLMKFLLLVVSLSKFLMTGHHAPLRKCSGATE